MNVDYLAILKSKSLSLLLSRHFIWDRPFLLEYRNFLTSYFSKERAFADKIDSGGDVIEYIWIVYPKTRVYSSGLGPILLMTSGSKIEFSTFHAIRKGDYRNLFFRYLCSKFVHVAAFALFILGSLALPVIMVIEYAYTGRIFDVLYSTNFWLTFTLLFCSILTLLTESYLALPSFARAIGRYPIQLQSLNKAEQDAAAKP